ncbi:antitoxin VbhA family protein [Sphingomonas sp. Leaf242]|uniref:antitoxin VbhA family protein n=1 Tax=Sphingomonas sp. Leaf242 TaxID=1736304 RepID=UPI0007156CEC|nr:hypothetical protein ASF09_19215 [Sphingomonas sp. Leaf242]
MPELSDEERMARQQAVDFARGSVKLSGGGLSPEIEALNRRYIAGDLSNAGVLQVFGVNDRESAHLVSDLLGQETVVFETMSRAFDAEGSGIGFGQQHVGRALLTPDEVRTLSPDRQLLFLAGQRPIIAGKLRYYADREFAGRFDPV